MPNKTLYVAPRQDSVWRRAEAFAAMDGVSVSSLVHRALRRYLDAEMAVTPGDEEELPPVTREQFAELAGRVSELERRVWSERPLDGAADREGRIDDTL